ncbi:MAG TPA: ABC transporter ATP-binding protein [Candidatus Acidoferrales bacterium]|nr:ABC transporter ATP-binding protein [Candidatus Acidoferrales bacterium]
MIELTHVSKDFGSRRAVDDVSFRVQRGEIIGLLGPNGSGKTTLMRILTGFFPPSRGQARVSGFDATADALALRRCIGYLPENVALYPEMGVRQFLRFCAGLRRLPRRLASQRVDDVLHSCGLNDVAGRLIGKLSKGYRQRVGLAQALLHEPAVLILDEPTVGLDPRQVMEMRHLIAAMRGRSTVLLSTHVLSEVSRLCDRVVIINRGHVIAEDSAEGLERRLAGAERTLVRVAGPREEVGKALAKVEGVEKIQLNEEAPDGASPQGSTRTANEPSAGTGTVVASFTISHSAENGAPARLAAAVFAGGWALYELRPLPLGMEELFLRLVGSDTRSNA